MAKGDKLDPFIKDPDARLDYAVSWEKWLAKVNDTLESSTWGIVVAETDPPLIIDSDVSNTIVATVWLIGGRPNTKYPLRNRIQTVGGRVNDKTVYVLVKEQ